MAKKTAKAKVKKAAKASPTKAVVSKKTAAASKGSAKKAGKAVKPGKAVKLAKGAKVGAKGKVAPKPSAPPYQGDGPFLGPPPDKDLPRADKLPPVAEELTKREMEQVFSVGEGRGTQGEGSLKGRLIVHLGFPYLEVNGRDKRQLWFLLQGPDQEVLPAYVDHKVTVSGLVRKINNHGGTVDVRKYSAKKNEALELPSEPAPDKLRFLSPGEIAQVSSPGMGSGMRGFASMRGTLEMTGEDFCLVVSNGGTRQQVSYLLQGKGARGLKRFVGSQVAVHGVVEKNSGWGGVIKCEAAEPRAIEFRALDRKGLNVRSIDVNGNSGRIDVRMNDGLSVRLNERAGFTWAVEPTTAKRMSLREANFESAGSGSHRREFFFTPRNPGLHEVEFFLAKAFNPLQVSKSLKLTVNVLLPTTVS